MIGLEISYLSSLFLIISGATVFAVLGSVCIMVYHLSMLKKNVINVDFNRSWVQYFKSWFIRRK